MSGDLGGRCKLHQADRKARLSEVADGDAGSRQRLSLHDRYMNMLTGKSNNHWTANICASV
jgi:hypothetical protein